MNSTFTSVPYSKTPFHNSFGRAYLWVIFVFFLFISTWGVVGQNGVLISSTETSPTSFNPVPITFKFDQPVNLFNVDDVNVTNGVLNNFRIETPEFSFLDFYNLDSFTVSTGNYEIELKKTVISVDINSKGDIFLLTQGNGLKKISADGTVQSFPVGGNYFTSPIDIAINSNDEIYVADNSDRKIYVFSSDGIPLPNKTLGSGFNGGNRTEFRGPMGLDFDDEDNLFVADRYEGSSTETFERNMIKIYYANGSYYEFYGRSPSDKFNIPYRVALDKRGYLYVSDIGNNNPRVQVFDISSEGATSFITTIGENEIDSPGSIAIDDYGFIYIADFGEDVNIVDILDLEGSGVLEILGTINSVISGIETEVFNIKVFDSEFDFRETIIEEIDLPIDLALDKCGKLFVNNANISSGGFLKYSFDFDLEIYNRLPDSFSASLTIAQECIPTTLKIPAGAANNVSCLNTTAANEFHFVWDQIKPVINCPTSIETISSNGEGKYFLPDYGYLANDTCDNNLTIAQNPLPGEITSNATVTIIAKDAAGNVSTTCSFKVELEQDQEPSFSCPEDGEIPELILDDNCDYEKQDFTSLVTIQNPTSATELIQTITRVNKILTVQIELKEDGVIVDECTFFVNLLDKTAPVIDCPSAPQILLKNEEGKFIIPDYASRVTDNCDSNPIIGQVPVPGTEVTEDTPIRLSAKDDSDNESEVCEFLLELQVTPPENQAPVAEDDNNYSVEQDGVLIVSVTEGVLINDEDETPDVLTAKLITNVTNGTLDFNEDGSFTYTPNGTVGTDVFTYMANDGELDSNIATVRIDVTSSVFPNFSPNAVNNEYSTPYETTLIIEKPGILGNDTDDDDDDLTAEIRSDVSGGILTWSSDGSFMYIPNPGFSGPDSFTYVANDGTADSNIATVTIQVGDPEGQNPPITQDDTFSIFIDETLDLPAPGILENDSFVSLTSIRLLMDVENGTLTLNNDGSFIFNPNSGFTGQDSFSYLILDGGMESNSATVTISVEPRPTLNEAPEAKDDFYEIQQDGILVVDAPGILGNDTDANGDVLTASVGSVPGSGSFEFNGDGSFKYTPLPGFFGTESFTYLANDGQLDSNIATVTITVNGTSINDFSCKDEFILQLDETGNAILQTSALYTGDPGDREFTLSSSNFDCTNIGENPVELIYTGDDGSGSCIINVRIEDVLPPEIQTQNISISLDSFGFATITPEMVDNGTSDNCGVPELSLDILNFSCENLGINTVVFTAEDASGNMATQTVNLNVTGNCKQIAISAIEYIYIYPNPTTGPFTFETPTGWIIEKVDVFDYRGRYITTAEFPLGEPYNMDLSTLQTAVYTLNLTTNQGEKIIRVIIR